MMVNECPEKHWLRIETEIAKKQAFELVKLLEAHAYRQHVHDHVIGKEEILLDRTREFITEENAWQMVIDGAFIDYSQDINKMLDFILIEPGAELPEPIIQMSALREPMPCKPCLQRQNSEE
jgi:predicted hydrolase (HD superfamily)